MMTDKRRAKASKRNRLLLYLSDDRKPILDRVLRRIPPERAPNQSAAMCVHKHKEQVGQPFKLSDGTETLLIKSAYRFYCYDCKRFVNTLTGEYFDGHGYARTIDLAHLCCELQEWHNYLRAQGLIP